MERAVTLLPEPDSPTIPSVWPSSSVKETPSTALTTPSGVLKCVLRLLTSSSATALLYRFPPRCARLPSGAILGEEVQYLGVGQSVAVGGVFGGNAGEDLLDGYLQLFAV